MVKVGFGSCQIKDLSAPAARITHLRRNVAIVVLRATASTALSHSHRLPHSRMTIRGKNFTPNNEIFHEAANKSRLKLTYK